MPSIIPRRPALPAITPKDCLATAVSQYGNGTDGKLRSQFSAQTANTAADSPPGPNFWQLGCVFDTMLDYAWLQSYAKQAKIPGASKMTRADLTKLMTDARQGYEYGIGANMAVWYDDWSWYGIAASKAFDPEYMELFSQGGQLEFFQNVALDMWGLVDHGDYQSVAARIPAEAWYTKSAWTANFGNGHWLSKAGSTERATYHRGTTQTWKNIEATRNTADDQYAFFTTPGKNWAKPRFDGGAWQYDMYESPLNLTCWDGNSTQHPNPAELGPPFQGPFQFTLMTGLYVVLAQRLAQAARIKGQLNLAPEISERLGSPASYDAAAASSFNFIDAWAAVDHGDHSWVRKGSKPSMILFRERVPTYAQCPGVLSGPGLLFVDEGYPVVPGFKSGNFWCGDQGLYLGALVAQGRLTQAKNLVAGVSKWLTSTDTANVVLGFTPADFPDPGDYASGSGIFWRYVLYACRTNPAVHDYFVDLVTSAPDDNIVAASASNPGNVAEYIFNPFNQVSVEVAACYILNEAKIGKPPAARRPKRKVRRPGA